MSKLVLFDVDHTLVKGQHGHLGAFNYAIEQVAGVKDFDIYHTVDMWGQTDRNILLAALRSLGAPEHLVEDCFSLMARHFGETLPQSDITVLPGVLELLQQIRDRGNVLGLVTGNVEAIAWMKLRSAGLEGFFRVGAFGSAPHSERSDLVHLAMGLAGVFCGFKGTLDDVFVVGDTTRDIEAGKKAGTRTIAVATGKHNAEKLRGCEPDLVVPNFALGKDEILKLLE